MSSDCAAVPADTSLEVWKMQIEAIRNKSVAERLQLAERRQNWLRQTEEDFIRRRFPDATPTQITVERIRHRHGDELARTVEPLLIARVARTDIAPSPQ
jgi:hypothetical protein